MYGYLKKRPEIVRNRDFFGIELCEDLPTRWEEYDFVRKALAIQNAERVEGVRLMDAACGIGVGVHIAAEIAASLGYDVEAVDLMPSKGFAENPRIRRSVGDMTRLAFESASFDAYLNISVLEHVELPQRIDALREGSRLLKPGGIMLVTADGFDAHDLARMFPMSVDVGDFVDFEGENLSPRVAFVIAYKGGRDP